jgi:hypothetical protein
VKTALLTTELLPVVGSGSNGPAALGDLDADGVPEVVTFSAIGPVYIFNGDGTSALGLDARRLPLVLGQEPFGSHSNSADAPTFGSLGGPAIAELRGPGSGYNVIAPTVGLGKSVDAALPAMQQPADSLISAWGMDRRLLPAFPRQVNDLQFFVVPVVADITGDGLPEILQGSGVRDLHGVDATGMEAPGWPKFTAGWTVTAPAVADVDGDGTVEVAHVTREGWLFVWRTQGSACGYHPWRHARHDAWGTSNIHTDALPPGRLGEVRLTSSSSDAAVFRTGLLPKDDLFCGAPAQLDVRFAEAPIGAAADFDRAIPVQSVRVTSAVGQRVLSVHDSRVAGRALYLAAVAYDDAGNRSAVSEMGRVQFASEPMPTATATQVPSATVTRSPTPTQVAGHDDDDGGCAVTPRRGGNGLAWLLVIAIVVGRIGRLRVPALDAPAGEIPRWHSAPRRRAVQCRGRCACHRGTQRGTARQYASYCAPNCRCSVGSSYPTTNVWNATANTAA